jgi:hypothetical protein
MPMPYVHAVRCCVRYDAQCDAICVQCVHRCGVLMRADAMRCRCDAILMQCDAMRDADA